VGAADEVLMAVQLQAAVYLNNYVVARYLLAEEVIIDMQLW
jgi:hypothetical protein